MSNATIASGQPGFGMGGPGGGIGPGFGFESGICGLAADDVGYSFTISGGTVTAVTITDGSHSSTVPLTSADSFTPGTGIVTEVRCRRNK